MVFGDWVWERRKIRENKFRFLPRNFPEFLSVWFNLWYNYTKCNIERHNIAAKKSQQAYGTPPISIRNNELTNCQFVLWNAVHFREMQFAIKTEFLLVLRTRLGLRQKKKNRNMAMFRSAELIHSFLWPFASFELCKI